MKLFKLSKSQALAKSVYKFPQMSFSHLNQVNQRNEELANNFINGSNTLTGFSHFLRHVNKNPDNKELLHRFTQELPKWVDQLDYLDTRKAISIVLNNEHLHDKEELISQLKSKFSEVRSAIEKDPGRVKMGANLEKLPKSINFWISFAKFRENVFISLRQSGWNFK